MADPLIELEGVRFAYAADRPVLTGADLRLLPGERVGMVGAIGCGKTTLLRLVVGLVKPDAGVVRAFGRDRRREADFHEVRRRAGLVFQHADDQLFCPTVIEDVAFGPLNLGLSPDEARATAAATLETLGLAGFADRITHKLSGGEKRLVSLATVLAMRPDVLLLDEPTGGLDEPSKLRLASILRELPQAMIVVGHEHDFVRDLSTRMVRMAAGQLLDEA
jgi:cobalt/nickel transport system ATP-binding protein